MITPWLMGKSERIKSFIRRRRIKKSVRLDNSQFLPDGIDRIYHVHIRKSAGSSINNLFLAQGNLTLKEFWREPLYIKNSRVFVQHSQKLINDGNYYYASSHFPLWELNLKSNTFTFCILREPVERLISLYKYYCWVAQVDDTTGYKLDPSYYVLLSQKHLLNKSFGDFINSLSPKYLFSELFTFDKELNPEKALEALNSIDKVYFFDQLEFTIDDLTQSLGLKPSPMTRVRSFNNVNFTVTSEEKDLARRILNEEIRFYNMARKKFSLTGH